MKSKLLLLMVILSLGTTACQNNSGTGNQTSSSTSVSSREKEMYDKGFQFGSQGIVGFEVDYYLSNNEEILKDIYRSNCKQDEIANKALYEQYKKGFIEGMKQRDAL